jgi:hypothetical protein
MSTTDTLPTDEMERVIDQRLDAIDRALLGLLPRQERLSIVTQMETRLRQLGGANTASDAYEQGANERARVTDTDFGAFGERAAAGRRGPSVRRKQSRLALSSGLLGILALALLFALPITYLVVGYVDLFEEAAAAVLGTHVVAVAIGGTLAVVLSMAGLFRLQNRAAQVTGRGWAITGLCTGPLPMFVGGLMVLVVGLQLLATQSVNAVSITTTSAPVTVPAPPFSPLPYPQAPSYSASLPPAPMASPDARSAPAGYPAPVCANEISGAVLEAPPEQTVPSLADFNEPNLAQPISPVEPALPLEAVNKTPAVESAPPSLE